MNIFMTDELNGLEKSQSIRIQLKNRYGNQKEIAYVLIGEIKDGIVLARMMWKTRGTETSVLFDGAKVLEREEKHGDLVGFYHTHPEGFTQPSKRDDDTMISWSFCFGKPLLCVVGTSVGLRAWVYDAAALTDGLSPAACAAQRKEVTRVEIFKTNRLVALV